MKTRRTNLPQVKLSVQRAIIAQQLIEEALDKPLYLIDASMERRLEGAIMYSHIKELRKINTELSELYDQTKLQKAKENATI